MPKRRAIRPTMRRRARPCVCMTRRATAQLWHERRVDAALVLRIQLRTQIVDYASIAIAERENCGALDAINVAHDKQFFDSRIEAALGARDVDEDSGRRLP